MSETYEEPLEPMQKSLVLSGKCPLCVVVDLDQKGHAVWCENDEECGFYTSREWIKYQTGKDPWAFELKVPKKRV